MAFLTRVWWPLRGTFDGLFAEYEVKDYRNRSYFADFAYLHNGMRILFEIQGYNVHVRDLDRKRFREEKKRDLFLGAVGFHVCNIAYDDVAEEPGQAIQLLRMTLARYEAPDARIDFMSVEERALVRFAVSRGGTVRPGEVGKHFRINYRTALRIIRQGIDKGWLLPETTGTGKRIVAYALHPLWWERASALL